jgi:hypothetical protein
MSIIEHACERAAVAIPFEAVSSLCDWYQSGNPPGFSPLCLGWSLRHALGDEGYEIYKELILDFDEFEAEAALRAGFSENGELKLLMEQWASFDQPFQRNADISLLTAMHMARDRGWEPPRNFIYMLDADKQAIDAFAEAEFRHEMRNIPDWNEDDESEPSSVAQSQYNTFGNPMTVLPFPATPPRKLILSDEEFVADFVAPEYLLDGILQRRFCYALTAQTGAGKTAVALRFAAHVGLGRKLGDRDVEQGHVLYFASENAVDVQARWIAMAEHCGFEIGKTNVQFVSGATRLSEIAEQITREADAAGRDLALVVVDTSAATFEGDDENSNVHAITHAKRMRSLTNLRGGPTVLVLCHPTKNAGAEELIPRGGGAFLAEIDGNLCARKTDSAVEVHQCRKFRGPDFAPMLFELRTVTAARLKDKRGRNIPTVLAAPLDEAKRQVMAMSGRQEENRLLQVIFDNPGAPLADIATKLGWLYGKDQKPNKMKVTRAAEALAIAKLLTKHRGTWMITSKGQQELNAIDREQQANRVPLVPLPPTSGFPKY